MIEIIKIFLAFIIPGTIGFGGGVASIAITSNAVVNTFELLTQQQMNAIISISNALPGPLATLLALGTGFYVKGIIGGIVGLLAMVVPSSIAIILLYNLLIKYKSDYRVKRITKYIMPIIIILFLQVALSFIIQSFILIDSNNITIGLIIFAIVTIYKLKINPAIIIVISMLYGYFIM